MLKSHASTFTAITSIPTDFDQSGREPELSAVSKSLLFSIAHNAMTNAYRHSGASRVRLSLGFEEEKLRMEVSDDGVGFRRITNSGDMVSPGCGPTPSD